MPRRPRKERLLGAFKVGASAITVFFAYTLIDHPSWAHLGGLLIAVAALLPAYMWCSGRVPGVPLFPLFALTYLWTYAYPLVSGHPIVATYEDDAILVAASIVTIFLLLATAAWFLMTTTTYRIPARIRAMTPGKGDYIFSLIIVLASLFTMSVVGQWFEIDAGLFAIFRAALFGLSSVGIFALSYRWGRGELVGAKKHLFLFALAIYVVSQLSTLFLVSGIVAVILAIVAYATGKRAVPWIWAVPFLALFAVLHAGKAEMRDQYWRGYEREPVQVWEYPGFFAAWFQSGIHTLTTPEATEASQPLYERVSLVHLLLKVLDETPKLVPYMNGSTYFVVPQLLVPRLFSPEKLTAHEGTTQLSVHYGLQTREDTQTTTIGWGLLNESVANFGVPGFVSLAIVIGILYGWVTKISVNVPILSLRMLVAITFMVFAVQTEFTAGVYVSALFQSLVSLLAMSFWFMDRKQKTVGPPIATK